MAFRRLSCKSEAILPKKLCPAGSLGWSRFIWEIVYPGYRDFGTRKTRDLGSRASSASYKHIKILTRERVATRNLGNRASLVDRAHMKRPLVAWFRHCSRLHQPCDSLMAIGLLVCFRSLDPVSRATSIQLRF